MSKADVIEIEGTVVEMAALTDASAKHRFTA